MKNGKRMAGEYEIIHAVYIGDREVVAGENQNASNGEKYMVANCQTNELFMRYDDCLVSGDYAEIIKCFGERIAVQAETIREELIRTGVVMAPFTADKCEKVDYKDCIEGKVVVIKAEAFRREYRVATHQLQLCTGGFGAQGSARGSACFCTNLYTGESSRFERRDILGTIKPECMPDWAKKWLESPKENMSPDIHLKKKTDMAR